VAGLTLTAIEGASVMVADAITALFAWLVAVTVTVCCDATLAGAVYNPLEPIVPAPDDGLIDQFTAVLLVFKTVAENCWVWLAYKVAVAGPTDTLMAGDNVTVAEAVAAVFAWLVAVTVMVCCMAMLAGAVYRPEELIVPVPVGLIDHVTAVLLVFETVAVNCWV